MPSPVNPICGRPGCKYKVPHEHVKFGEPDPPLPPRLGIWDVPVDDFMSPATKKALAAEKRDISEDAISKALLRIGASEDPEADRFKGKSPVEAQVIMLGERMAKYADQTDKAFAVMSDITRKTHATVEACWEHWKKDQQRPAWAQDFAEWLQQGIAERIDPLVSNTAKIVMDGITFRKEIRSDTDVYKRAVESLLRRRSLSVWGVVLGAIIGIYASLASALLVIVAAAHTQQFWTWITEGLGL